MLITYGFLIAAAAVVVYTIVGYPILLALHAGRAAPRIMKDLSFQPTVTVIVAIYNGAPLVSRKIEALLALDYPKHLIEIILVSDGSTDATDSIVREYCCKGITLLRVPHGGKAAALNTALAHASGDVVFFTDVRQPLDPSALRHLAANFADPTVGAVTGQLRLLHGDHGEQADMDLYWRYENWAREHQSKIYSLFNTTGCIYAMRRNLIEAIPADTLSDDAILPLRAFFRGYRVIFDPEAIAYDYPAVAGTEFRRRFRNLAGLYQVHARMPQLFNKSNPMRFHFMSHKFSRLLLPWALLVIAASTLALPDSGLKTILLTTEITFVLLAVVNRFIPRELPLKRLSSPIQTFLIMNAASMMALTVFFVPPARLWKPTRVETGK
jgi:biofilm PGA synthesis N-glycosyltransferase PgaC